MRLKDKEIKLIKEMVEQDYINVQKHNNAELYIYNYSHKAQFDRVWNEATILCRGLIVDNDYNIIARPFKKFFNIGEFEGQEIPAGEFEVQEKYDGSLGIMYWLNEKPYIATRGSFHGEQAVKATEMLHKIITAGFWDGGNKDLTYLFEIIYPENRIVVDYGDLEDLIFLAAIDKETGEDVDVSYPLSERARHGVLSNFSTLKDVPTDNREGFVLKYKDGFRLKIKFEEYVRLHRIVTGINERRVWEMLRNRERFDDILTRVPDEFFNWVESMVSNLKHDHMKILQDARRVCDEAIDRYNNRKDQAELIKKYKYPAVAFAMLDNKDFEYIEDIVWKILKPKSTKPFKIEI